MTKQIQTQTQTENNFDRVYRLFVNWQVQTPAERDPKTLEAFATKHKVSLSDLTTFTNTHGYHDDIEREATKWGRSKLPEMLHLLYTLIKSRKKASDIEVFKKLITKDANAPQGNTINVFNLNEEQRNQILVREARTAGLLPAGGKK